MAQLCIGAGLCVLYLLVFVQGMRQMQEVLMHTLQEHGIEPPFVEPQVCVSPLSCRGSMPYIQQTGVRYSSTHTHTFMVQNRGFPSKGVMAALLTTLVGLCGGSLLE